MVPKRERLIVGDAVDFTVTQKAKGVPDILLSPVVYRSGALLHVYTKEPKLESGEGEGFDAIRMDRFTFVAIAEGNITLPARKFVWWDPLADRMHTEMIPELSFEILPDPQIALDAQKARQRRSLLYSIMALLAGVGLYLLWGTRIQNWVRMQKERYKKSEPGRFAFLVRSIQKESDAVIYDAFYTWLATADTTLAARGAEGIARSHPAMGSLLEELADTLAVPGRSFDRARFREELKQFRKRLLNKKRAQGAHLPETINPR